MAIPTRVVKRRIKSIRSTGKIMKAMELVAASKMRKATQLALGTRPYSHLIHEMVQTLSTRVAGSFFPLLVGRGREVASLPTLLVVFASDRGLCGGFNNQLLKKVIEFSRSQSNLLVASVGRRAEHGLRRAGLSLSASFESISNAPSFDRAQPLGAYILQTFLSGKVGSVYLAYTDFVSALVQKAKIVPFLPILSEQERSHISISEVVDGIKFENNELDNESIIFEPSSREVMERLLPRMVEMREYQAFLESAASEHAARMMAMRSAGDAAKEMLENLTLTLNQARQATITREISEISAGKAAIE